MWSEPKQCAAVSGCSSLMLRGRSDKVCWVRRRCVPSFGGRTSGSTLSIIDCRGRSITSHPPMRVPTQLQCGVLSRKVSTRRVAHRHRQAVSSPVLYVLLSPMMIIVAAPAVAITLVAVVVVTCSRVVHSSDYKGNRRTFMCLLVATLMLSVCVILGARSQVSTC